VVAETFEAAEVIAGLAAEVRALLVVAGAEVVVAGFGVGEQGVGDGQDGVAGRDEGFLFLAVVIGSGGREDNPQRWRWYEFTSGAYREIGLGARQRRFRLTSDADTEVWAADRRGCRPLANL
jgi:hypothetical protein